MGDEVDLATVELLGALAYGQLRSFEAVCRTIALAPDARTADALADHAVIEHASYRRLRDHLATRTQLATAVMDRQKPHFDRYFDRVPLDSWLDACVFFALGLPIAADFTRWLAPVVDDTTAAILVAAVEDRRRLLDEATSRLTELLVDESSRDHARHRSADLVGRALTGFQGVVADTDALKVLLAADTGHELTGEQRVKQLAVSVMGGHHRRVIELGLEDVDDVR